MSPAPSFELLGFEATPVTTTVAVVELSGAFAGLSPTRPRLLVETGGVAREMPALSSSSDDEPWTASFAVPLSSLVEEARFALVPGRGPLIELPAPSVIEGDADRFVAVARSANDLRHRVGELEASHESLVAELESVRSALSAAEERVTESHDAALNAREEQARAEGEAEEARDEVARARVEWEAETESLRSSLETQLEALRSDLEEARAEIASANSRADAAEEDTRAVEADLAFAQERVESLMRESREARTAVAALRSGTGASRSADLDDGPADSEGDEGDVDGEIRASRSSGVADSAPSGDAADPRTEPLPADDSAAPDEPDVDEDTSDGPADSLTAEWATGADDAPTEERPSPGLWRDEEDDSGSVLRPRTNAGRKRPAAALAPLSDDDDEDEDEDDFELEPVESEVSPARRALEILSSPRVIVGGIFVLLIVALILIFSGIGPAS